MPEVSISCCLTKAPNERRATSDERRTIRLISSLSSLILHSNFLCVGLAVARISLNCFSPRRCCAVLFDLLGTLMVVYHGTAEWSAEYCSIQAVYRSMAAFSIASPSIFDPALLRLSYSQASCAFDASPEHFLSLRPLGLRSDVIHSLVLRTTPACIASYPWRMTD